MVVGIIIGASIFVQPTEVSRYVPSIPGVFAVWLAAGLLALAGALVCSELSSAFPETGGVYCFINETIPPAAGFLWGWAMFWSAHSGIVAAASVVFGRYVAYFTPLDDRGIRIVAIGGILLLSAVNYLGVRQGSRVQTIITAAKIIAIAAILILVAVLGKHAAAPTTATSLHFTISDFALAVGAGLFAFGGWHMVTYAAGETRNPEKTIPRALLIGTLTVTAGYLALNAACLYLLPLDRCTNSTRVAADAPNALVGSKVEAATSGLVLVSTIGSL